MNFSVGALLLQCFFDNFKRFLINLDPTEWSCDQVRAWLQFTIKQFKITLTQDIDGIFDEDGKQLLRLNEIDFINRIPEVIEIKMHIHLSVLLLICVFVW